MIPLKKLFLFLLSLSVIGFSTQSVAADFAMGNWGDPQQSIIENETRENFTPPSNQKYLIFKGVISIFEKTDIVYLFEKNALVDGYFNLLDEHILFRDYIDDYLIIQKQLSKKYNLPQSNEQIWHPDAQILPKDQWGNAIANDDLILKSIWQTQNSTITLQLSHQQNRIHHLLSYRSQRPEIEVMTPDDF